MFQNLIRKISQIFGFKISQSILSTRYPGAKVKGAVIDYIYGEGGVGVATAIICATVLFFGVLFEAPTLLLFLWYPFFLIVAALRYGLIRAYKTKYREDETKLKWLRLFIWGAALAGISWGIVGVFLLPASPRLSQLLMILILAGVASGALPLLSGSLIAMFVFITPLVLPVAIFFCTRGNYQSVLVGITIFLYWIFLLTLSKKTNELLLKTVQLQFENDELLENLFSAKKALESANVKLKDAATHDSLTKLPNRTFFLFFLGNAIKRAKRSDTLVAMFYFDLDGFKTVNDEFGHDMGDKLLVQVTKRLKSKLRTEDFLSRLGGDEFAVIAENINTMDDCYSLAENICKVIAKPFEIDGNKLKVTASVGISIYPIDDIDPEVLLTKADKAMYHVKKAAKNGFAFCRDIAES